ncbi:MAG: hypothetical protein M1832_000283 [Thelocarpon impressellum]|nr:MAG: hypothetical protein M1832_000283 [Thelocarpon impressellum]
MDLANTLIRSVARAFYETKHVLVVDALMVHSALRDDDLAHLLGMQTKELRKLCAKLEEHRLLAVHNRQEAREGAQRPITKTYYFVDYRQTLDAIKYRMYRIGKEVEGMERPTEEKKDYSCPRCKSQWTQLEVLDNIGPMGFLCHKCGALLQRDENIAGDGGHEKQSQLNSQLKPLLDLLPQIDDVFIPDSSFEKALNSAVPVARNQTTNPIAPTVPVDPTSGNLLTAVKGLSQASVQQIEVSLTSTDEKTLAEQVAEEERKAALAKQNALPVWISKSTVSGEATALGRNEEAARREREGLLGVKTDEAGAGDDKKRAAGEELNDELAGYYQLMAEEKERETQRKLEEEEEEEDDDEDEDEDEDEGDFEDVPAASNGAASALNGLKRASTTTSPSTNTTTAGADASLASKKRPSPSPIDRPGSPKKARQEVEGADSEEDEDEGDEEEVEFEDV